MKRHKAGAESAHLFNFRACARGSWAMYCQLQHHKSSMVLNANFGSAPSTWPRCTGDGEYDSEAAGHAIELYSRDADNNGFVMDNDKYQP